VDVSPNNTPGHDDLLSVKYFNRAWATAAGQSKNTSVAGTFDKNFQNVWTDEKYR
jgi:hypothetical protein